MADEGGSGREFCISWWHETCMGAPSLLELSDWALICLPLPCMSQEIIYVLYSSFFFTHPAEAEGQYVQPSPHSGRWWIHTVRTFCLAYFPLDVQVGCVGYGAAHSLGNRFPGCGNWVEFPWRGLGMRLYWTIGHVRWTELRNPIFFIFYFNRVLRSAHLLFCLPVFYLISSH